MEVSGQLHATATLPPAETAAGTHWIGGWVGLRASLGSMEQRKILPLRESNPSHPARSPPLHRLSYPSLYIYLCVHAHAHFAQLTFTQQTKCAKISGDQPC
jgi:hypothetical protein